MRILKNKKGFTLIELTVVISIMGILTAIAVPRFIGFIEHARIVSDQMTVRNLNSITPLARMSLSIADPFLDENSTDEELIEFLVDESYLSSVVEPQTKDATFAWLIDDDRWYLLMGNEFHTISFDEGFVFNFWGEANILDGNYTGSSQNIVIPTKLEDEIITEIYQRVFKNKGLITVSFAEGSQIEHIHRGAFQNNNLTEIVLPDSLKRIDGRAFYGNDIETVKIPDGVTYIEEKVFSNLQQITVGSELETINKNAINGNDKFRTAYRSENGGAGTYIWDGENWVKQ